MTAAPRVGITGRLAAIDGVERFGVNGAYLHAVVAGGGAPVVFAPVVPLELVPVLLEGVDALILSGGADIDPVRFGAPRHPKLRTVEPDRDRFEFALFAEARRRELPVLAICRGLQLANVALGGSLWQDLPAERSPHPQSGPRTERVHGVTFRHGSALRQALGVNELRVNSFHHQAIRDLAPGLIASAHTDDGLIEGIEADQGGWLVGVQWHPEEFWADPRAADLGLFRALVAASAGVPR